MWDGGEPVVMGRGGKEVSDGAERGFIAKWWAVLIPTGKDPVGRTPSAISKSPKIPFD